MEQRVAVEGDLKEIKTAIQRMETSQARMEVLTGNLATKVDVAALKGSVDTSTARIDAQTGRINALETANTTTINTALSKTFGVPGAVGLFVSLAVVVTAAIAVLRFLHFFP